MKPVGKPDALIGHVRFDERGWETGRRRGVSARAHPRLYRMTRQISYPCRPAPNYRQNASFFRELKWLTLNKSLSSETRAVTEWNNWREADWGVIADLSGADLHRAHLSGAALIGTNLENASKRNPISRG